jgi:hypothetical protein
MKIEKLELPSTTKIELNTAPEKQIPSWQGLDSLSTGQKATAVLLLLLLESEAPLIVDQPEDDLDNRFIIHHLGCGANHAQGKAAPAVYLLDP